MFDHVTIRVSDRAASVRFYRTVLATLGNEQSHTDETYPEWDDFSLRRRVRPSRSRRGCTSAFVAPSRAHVDEFWRVGRRAGYRSDGEPGPRPQYRDDYYGELPARPGRQQRRGRAPRGACAAVEHRPPVDPRGGRRGVEAVLRDRRARTPTSGCGRTRRTARTSPAASGSFSVCRRRADEQFHLAFPATDNATVHAFHAAAIAAGYRDNGPPGERPVYHPGYYGAFVLDPDGNNVEVVNHHRD